MAQYVFQIFCSFLMIFQLAAFLPIYCTAFKQTSAEIRNQQRSAQLNQFVRLLAQSISQLLDEDFAEQLPPILRNSTNSPPTLSELLDQKQFRPSIGVSADPKGEAATNASMVYIWTPEGTVNGEGIFKNGSAILAGRPLELGDYVHLDGEENDKEIESRFKRAPKGGAGGGRGGGGGGRGGGGGGRGGGGRTSGGRSYAKGGSVSAGKGAIRPHVWIFASSGHSYRWMDDSEEDAAENGQIVDDIRMEISLCFGAHKKRESCSAKVDAMLEKMAMEKRASIEQWERMKHFLYFIGFLTVTGILCLICRFCYEQELQQEYWRRRH